MQSLAELESFMREYEISMRVMKVNQPQSARVDGLDMGVDRYQCRMTRPGRRIDVFVAVPSEEQSITPSDILFMLILDASGCQMLQDYYRRQDELAGVFGGSDGNLEEMEEFWREYESRCCQTRKLESFLGKSLMEELIGQFGFKE